MKALVLGADGFMGKKMCQYLIEAGREVKAFDISEMHDLRDINGIECVQGDFQMIDTIDGLFDDVDEVYDFICTTIPKSETSSIPHEIEINLVPLTRLLQKLHDNSIEKFVFVSSAGTVYGDGKERKEECDRLEPICSYGTLKQVSEAYIELYNRKYGHNYRIARVSNPYGVGQHKYKTQGIIPIFIDAIMSGQPITIYGDGDKMRDYIYIDDVIEALYLVCNYDNRDRYIFNIASGESHSINELVDILEDEVGRFTQINHGKPRDCDVDCNLVDISRTVDSLKWRPKVGLKEGINKTYKLMR